MTYALDRLPDGYTVWGKPRKTQPSHIDKWAYGHPSGKTFDSPNRFSPHFLHLMNNEGSNVGCPCSLCSSGGGKAPALAQAQAQTTPRPGPTQGSAASMQTTLQKFKGKPRQVDTSSVRTDDEGTPDIYRNLIDKLRRNGQIDEPIKETMSMDWRAERKALPALLDQLSKQGQWVPRPGEIILFVRSLSPGTTAICFDDATGQYRVWSHVAKRFGAHPRWEAGIVTQPAAEPARVDDLMGETDKKYQQNYSGFRVEPIPDPNSTVKHWSKQHKYLALHAMRPFNFWSEFLDGIPEADWHPTIKHAFTATSSLSLVEKERFIGTWPTASITCRGIYIGSELILTGDTVRLMPKQQGDSVTDVLQITSIKLNLMNLDTASDDDYDQNHPYNSTVHVTGKAITAKPDHAANRIKLTQAERIELRVDGYEEEWYWMHAPERSFRVPFHRILGRCFEAEAITLWFPPRSSESANEHGQELSRGLEGMFRSRHYSSHNYVKIERGKSWFWGDSRVEALDLATINGQEVGTHDNSRDPKTWRKLIKIMEGNAEQEDKLALKKAALAERPLRQNNNSIVTSSWRAINIPAEQDEGEIAELPQVRKRPHSVLGAEKNARAGVDTDVDVDMDDDEAAADQFVEELAGLAQSDEEPAESDDGDVIMLDESRKQKRLELRFD